MMTNKFFRKIVLNCQKNNRFQVQNMQGQSDILYVHGLRNQNLNKYVQYLKRDRTSLVHPVNAD